jgi:hypothetical protein
VGFGIIAATPELATRAAAEYAAALAAGRVTRSGPRGEVITVNTFGDDSGWQAVTVNVYLGQTNVFASSSNDLPIGTTSGATAGSPRVGRPDLPLTAQQLIDIATAPELNLFP